MVVCGLCAAAACGNAGEAGRPDGAIEQQGGPPQDQSAIDRGKYLASVGGCHDCHTPFKPGPQGPEPDTARLLAGHPQEVRVPRPPALVSPWLWVGAATNTAFAGPWGVTYATNLTPDSETGIGSWSEQVFVNALKTGRHMGVGRPILPPMPWQGYSMMTDEDLKALFAYLQSVEPRKNLVPDAELAPPPGRPETPPTSIATPGLAPAPDSRPPTPPSGPLEP